MRLKKPSAELRARPRSSRRSSSSGKRYYWNRKPKILRRADKRLCLPIGSSSEASCGARRRIHAKITRDGIHAAIIPVKKASTALIGSSPRRPSPDPETTKPESSSKRGYRKVCTWRAPFAVSTCVVLEQCSKDMFLTFTSRVSYSSSDDPQRCWRKSLRGTPRSHVDLRRLVVLGRVGA